MANEQSTPAPSQEQAIPFDPIRYLDEIPPDKAIVRCTHVGEPIAKQRPRFSPKNSRVYTPGSTRDHQRALAALARSKIGFGVEPDGEWAFGIRAAFYVQTYQRKDVDNMLKVVLDGMNHLLFKDDSQVKELMGWSTYDAEHPRTEFIVYRLHKIDRTMGHCTNCGKTFRLYKSWKTRLYCSRACLAIKERRAQPTPCSRCGKVVARKPSELAESATGDHFCSNVCKWAHRRLYIPCAFCGTVISRPQSWVTGQRKFYCSVACRGAGKVGTATTTPPETRHAAALKGWETRRAQTG